MLLKNKEKYRQFCQTEKSLPIFSQAWWLDTVCGEKNWNILLVEEKERIVATMPLYTPINGVISMPPYTQTMGPWISPESDDTKYTTALGHRQTVCKVFTDKLKEYSSFLQNFNYQITDWLPFYWAGYQQTTRYTYILEDIDDENALWENMSRHIRRNITKAKEKCKITIKQGVSVHEFLKIHSQTFERQQKKANQTEVLKKLITVCRERGQGDIWGGYDEKGNLHAAVFVVWQESCAYYLAGGGNPDLRESGAHSYVLWESIRFVSSKSKRFDFEGSMLPGVERFFREFGAIQTPYSTITKGKPGLLDRIRIKLQNK